MSTKHVIVVGAGFHGLMCALEAQRRNPAPRVDIIAQVFPGDSVPLARTTGFSRCYFSCLKQMCSNFEEATFRYLEECSSSTFVKYFHRFKHTEYFSMSEINDNKVLEVPELLPPESLVEGAQHGSTFWNISLKPDQMATAMFNEFVSAGGGVYRGTVRNLNEVVEGGISSFRRMSKLHPEHSIEAPSAIIVCLGLGARFIGGIEDTTVTPARIQFLRLRAPQMTCGKAYYNNDKHASFFAIPLGNGDVIIGGSISYNDWLSVPRPQTTQLLLKDAKRLCPELVPPDHDASVEFDLASLVVWEGCDIFGTRKDGPRLEVKHYRIPNEGRNIPVILNYGYGEFELQTFSAVAKAAVNLLQAALDQERENTESMPVAE